MTLTLSGDKNNPIKLLYLSSQRHSQSGSYYLTRHNVLRHVVDS